MTMMKRLAKLAGMTLALALLVARPGQAGSTEIWTASPFYLGNTTQITFSGSDNTPLSSISDGTLTVSFSNTMLVENVPSGWSTWGSPPNTQSSTPVTLWTGGPTMVTLTLSAGEDTFGFELEPDVFGIDPVSATFYNGATPLFTANRNVNGNGGALLFAVVSTTPITSVAISDWNYDDFAIADVRYSAVPIPEPASMLLLGTSLAGLGLRKFRRKRI